MQGWGGGSRNLNTPLLPFPLELPSISTSLTTTLRSQLESKFTESKVSIQPNLPLEKNTGQITQNDMNSNKTYFLVSGWDFPVGSIELGSIIANPTQPHIALYNPKPNDIDTKIHPTDKEKYVGVAKTEKGDKNGLFFRFLDLFGLGAEVGFKYDRRSVLEYSFKKLHTEWFLPSDELKKKAVIDNTRVSEFCKAYDYESAVYMITGLKTVEGAGVKTFTSKGKDWRAFLGVEAGPVNVGPQSTHTSEVSQLVSFENSTPIVFAFQLIEIKCSENGELASSPVQYWRALRT
ncbi:hypothetical protein G7Y89_g9987 [Cudoniella acicularis]|uniref:Uncharacterized protein n=1 Tax=Cudoniella acicularis TaxID=354080 RepID=A0A8H4REM7_9HELO|nr:hypothetical protein G7Y89_g9987 [Cudoniella acicularis]